MGFLQIIHVQFVTPKTALEPFTARKTESLSFRSAYICVQNLNCIEDDILGLPKSPRILWLSGQSQLAWRHLV